MSKTCYYEVLGVSRDADERQLKKAYRKIAMENHPDRNPGDAAAEERFKAAAEAYEVLRDGEKRQLYDRYGHEGLRGQGQGFRGMDDIFSQFGDIFGDLFGMGGGGGGRGRGPRRGPDLRYDMELAFEEAITGTRKKITVPRHVVCETCDGSGAKAGSKPITCPQCRGRGQITHQQGFFMLSTTCPACNGAGQTIANKCGDCGGAGKKRQNREVTVNIPAGVDQGTRLRLRAEGELGDRGAPPGDLYVFVHVAEHPHFQRRDYDLHLPWEISFVQAALGATITIPTLEGEDQVKIDPGTQHGQRKVLRNRGVQHIQGKRRGDLIVHFGIQIPKALDATSRELLEQYAQHNDISLEARAGAEETKAAEA